MKIFASLLLLTLQNLNCDDEAYIYDFTTNLAPFSWIVAPNNGPKAISSDTFTKNFNESCHFKTNCKSGYSQCIDEKCGCTFGLKNGDWELCLQCKNKVCACIDNFEVDKFGICRPKTLNCPGVNGSDVLIFNAKTAKKCIVKNNFEDKWVDSCDTESEFCFVHKNEETKEGHRIGHCCPKLKKYKPYKSTCPMGESLDDFHCKALVEKSLQTQEWDYLACQSQTGSYCTKWKVGRVDETFLGPKKGLDCCRLPCEYPDTYYYIDGICHLTFPFFEKRKLIIKDN